MAPITIKLTDFTSKKNYLDLQKRFLQYCEKQGGPATSLEELKPNNFQIIYKVQSDLNEEKYHHIKFNEFVSDQIKFIADRVLSDLSRKIQKMDLVKDDELKRFIDKKLKVLDNIKGKINCVPNLDKSHVEELNLQISDIAKKLDSKEFEKGFVLEKRIKIDLRQNDLLLLIALLQNNEIVDRSTTTTELGLAIDQVFAFKNITTKQYQNYEGSAHKIEGIVNGSVGIKKSKKRLKEIFKEDFFEKL